MDTASCLAPDALACLARMEFLVDYHCGFFIDDCGRVGRSVRETFRSANLQPEDGVTVVLEVRGISLPGRVGWGVGVGPRGQVYLGYYDAEAEFAMRIADARLNAEQKVVLEEMLNHVSCALCSHGQEAIDAAPLPSSPSEGCAADYEDLDPRILRLRPRVKLALLPCLRLSLHEAEERIHDRAVLAGYRAIWRWAAPRGHGAHGRSHDAFRMAHGEAAYWARINKVREACGFEAVVPPVPSDLPEREDRLLAAPQG